MTDPREDLARLINDEHQCTRAWDDLRQNEPAWTRSNGDDYAIKTAYDAVIAAGWTPPLKPEVTSGERPMDLLSAPTEEDAQVMAGVEVASRWFSERPWWLAHMVRAVLAEVTDEYDAILQRQSQLLRDTVNALRGDPPPLTWHSLHDVPDLAKAAVEELAQWTMGDSGYDWATLTPKNQEHYRAEARAAIIEGATE